MLNVGGALRPVLHAKVAGLPVGPAVIYAGSIGVGDFVKGTVHGLSGGRVPQWASGLLLVWALNTRQGKSLVGSDVAEIASVAILADTINDQMDIQGKVSNFFGSLVGRSITSRSPAVSNPLGGGRGGDQYAGLFR